MGIVVDLIQWKGSRRAAAGAVSGGGADPAERLEQAVHRLDQLVGGPSEPRPPVPKHVETELLAIMGAVTAGLVDVAADRAERLAERLGRVGPSRA